MFTVQPGAGWESVAADLLAQYPTTRCFLFQGEMGAGKTTLIKALCSQLEVQDDVASPTYSIVNEYIAANGNMVRHADLFRLNSMEEALDIGIEDMLYDTDAYFFIEWPGVIEDLLPPHYASIHIARLDDETRQVVVLQNTLNHP